MIDDDDSNQDDGEDESEDDEELEVKVQNEAAATVKIKNEAGQPQYEMGLEWVPEIVPPSSDVGRRVVWDANVKVSSAIMPAQIPSRVFHSRAPCTLTRSSIPPKQRSFTNLTTIILLLLIGRGKLARLHIIR